MKPITHVDIDSDKEYLAVHCMSQDKYIVIKTWGTINVVREEKQMRFPTVSPTELEYPEEYFFYLIPRNEQECYYYGNKYLIKDIDLTNDRIYMTPVDHSASSMDTYLATMLQNHYFILQEQVSYWDTPKVCTCDSRDLFWVGCICGAMKVDNRSAADIILNKAFFPNKKENK